MRFISNHIPFLNRVVAIVVFLASSGFTTILHNCTMEMAACCEAPMKQKHDQCGESLPHNAEFRSDLTCHSNTVVGGVTPSAAVFEKDNKSELKKLDAPPVFAAPVVHFMSQVSHTTLRFASSADIVFLPSVEKYVLNATFLI